MEHAEIGKRHLAEHQPPGAAWVPPAACRRDHGQAVDGRAGSGERGERFGLGIIGIERRSAAAAPIARPRFAGHQQRQRRMLAIRMVTLAEFEQPCRRLAAIGVAFRRRQQPGQQRGSHRCHISRNRIGQRPGGATKGIGIGGGQEAPGHRLVETTRRRAAAQLAFQLLRRGRGRLGDPFGTRQRRCRHAVEAIDADYLLHKVGFAVPAAVYSGHTANIAAPRRHGHLPW